jgi:hypothetical protein
VGAFALWIRWPYDQPVEIGEDGLHRLASHGRVGRQLLQEIAWLTWAPTGRSAMRLAGTHPRALLSDALA